VTPLVAVIPITLPAHPKVAVDLSASPAKSSNVKRNPRRNTATPTNPPRVAVDLSASLAKSSNVKRNPRRNTATLPVVVIPTTLAQAHLEVVIVVLAAAAVTLPALPVARSAIVLSVNLALLEVVIVASVAVVVILSAHLVAKSATASSVNVTPVAPLNTPLQVIPAALPVAPTIRSAITKNTKKLKDATLPSTSLINAIVLTH
jgi:hypothetical protein